MLELRLKEMDDGVDYFVIGEASHNFKGESKSFTLLENWDRYKPWHHKIRRIQIDLEPDHDPWINEALQRNELWNGLYDADDQDLVMLLDCDEIIRNATIRGMKRMPDVNQFSIRAPQFFFKLNNLQKFYYTSDGIKLHVIVLTIVYRFKVLKQFGKTQFSDIRKCRLDQGNVDKDLVKIWHGGWHFSFVGDDSFVKNKMATFDYTWLKLHEKDSIEKLHKSWNCTPCAITEYMPRAVQADPVRWANWLIPGSFPDAREILDPFLNLQATSKAAKITF